jgi:hypothetical protein
MGSVGTILVVANQRIPTIINRQEILTYNPIMQETESI